MTEVAPTTHYRRELPAGLVAFSSPRGREMFRDALAHGTLEGWFPLAEQFHTQAEPAFCGLGSLVVALNALGVDPHRAWKGVWRWYSEELLDCCVPLPAVAQRGITLFELGCLARCNGLAADVRHADTEGLEALTADLARAARGDGSVVIAAYSRAALGQSGEGHFSPLAGLDVSERHTLILDVARFKYPPHWVRVEALHAAMRPIDEASGRSRGWAVLRRRSGPTGLLATLTCGHDPWRDVLASFDRHLAAARAATDLGGVLTAFVAAARELAPHITWRDPTDPEHRALLFAMQAELRQSPAGRAFAAAASAGDAASSSAAPLAPLLFYVMGPDLLADATGSSAMSPDLRATLADISATETLLPGIAAEIDLLRQQLASLRKVERQG